MTIAAVLANAHPWDILTADVLEGLAAQAVI